MPRILIIDDNQDMRTVLKEILERKDYSVETAFDGEDGMKIFRAEPADLVITDIIMPNKEGAEVIFELFKDFPDVPVIAISGGGQLDSKQCLEMVKNVSNVKYTLKKPFSNSELLEAVKQLVG
ncbi:MAG: response regulator [Candidatus Omnitrophica bacterium]|nr:response regulator [Candidatus Omnitrophota bacterium]